MPENDFDYYSRRALEEGHAAGRAACPVARAAHRRLAAAYAAMLVDGLPDEPDFDAMLHALA